MSALPIELRNAMALGIPMFPGANPLGNQYVMAPQRFIAQPQVVPGSSQITVTTTNNHYAVHHHHHYYGGSGGSQQPPQPPQQPPQPPQQQPHSLCYNSEQSRSMSYPAPVFYNGEWISANDPRYGIIRKMQQEEALLARQTRTDSTGFQHLF
jgi:hypothetical protein